jgi:hypothetical protein
MRKFLYFFGLSFILCCNLISCTNKSERPTPKTNDVNKPATLRWEQKLFSLDTHNIVASLQKLNKEEPVLYPFFINGVLELPDSVQQYDKYSGLLKGFVASRSMREVYDTIQKSFGDFSKYDQQFQQAFKYYKHYFPKKDIPQVVTFISQFGPRTFIYENKLGIGLDMYLGKNYKYYPTFGFPDFLVKRFDSKYIISDAIFTLMQDQLQDPLKNGSQLIDMMVYYGKIYYMTSMILPKNAEQDFFYYSSEDWKWVQENEQEIWSFFIEGEWLYSTQYNGYRKFIEDGPTTMGMPQGAPDRVARWVGYRMVQKYMERFPETSADELFAIESGQKILSASQYKPERK